MNEALTEQFLAEHRPVLFRYALLKLSDTSVADDAVQETLLAALQSSAEYEGKSSLRTWLIGILKHKIADHWRRNASEELHSISHNFDADDELSESDFFLADGHWSSPPKTWADPEAALKQSEFWIIYEACQNNLPPSMANVFMLRELVGLETNEICLETGISEANFWVIMHRARLRLRECLENRWFNLKTTEKDYA